MAKSLKTIPFEYVVCDDERNYRKIYEEIDDLAASIQTEGLLQPIGVSEVPNTKNEYYVEYGFRRYYAICKIREKFGDEAFAEIDVVVVTGTAQDLRQKNLRENLDRKSLKPHEISEAIKAMVNSGLEQRDIAARLGRPQSWVSYHYKAATKLNVAASKAFEAGELTLEQALYIADVPEDEQTELVQSIVEAETRNEARQIAKDASKKSGARRTYANKGRPTAKNLAQKVRDVSFDATGNVSGSAKAFYNGVAAGMRIALGDVEKVTPDEDYYDVNFAKAEDKPAKAEKVKGKRGRKKKVVATEASATA